MTFPADSSDVALRSHGLPDLFAVRHAPLVAAPRLSDEQRAASRASARHVLVRAGAGTGKTTVLVDRIRHFVEDLRVPPERVAAVSFTRRAAGELRERVSRELGASRAGEMVLGTFHSVSMRILRRNHAEAGLSSRFMVLDDDEVHALTREATLAVGAVRTTGDEAEDGRRLDSVAREAAAAIRKWKAWGLTPEVAEAAGRRRRSDAEERNVAVYLSYQDDLRRRDLTDFGDLVMGVVSLFARRPQVMEAEAARTTHLLVDEGQDANPMQVRWARAFRDAGSRLTVVGDDDQSIFGYQGGYPGAMAAMAGPDAGSFDLVRNRRCTDEMLAPAVRLVGWNRRERPKTLSSGRSGEPVTLRLLGGEHEEAKYVAERVGDRLREGASPDQVAVLLRASWAMGAIEEAFVKGRVPYRVVGGASLSEREEVRDVLAYLRLSFRPDDGLAFARVLNRPARGLGTAALAAVVAARRPDEPFHAACERVRRMPKEPSAERWNEGLSRLARALATLAARSLSDECTSSELVRVVMNDAGCGYASFVAADKDKARNRRRSDSLDAIVSMARQEPSPVDFVDRIATSTDDVGDGEPRVRISTIHSSKGLEWDHVFLPAFVQPVMPSPRAVEQPVRGDPDDPWDGPSGGGVEEERRLAHVAFTRARTSLTVTATLSRDGQRCMPSPFLPEAGLSAILDQQAEPALGGRRGAEERAGRKGFAKTRA